LNEWLAEDRARGFDPSRAPLMRHALIRLGDDSWRFVWSFHHLLLDGWSTALLLKEVLASYGARQAGREIPRDRVRPFRDHIAWLKQQDMEQARRFWQERLRGFTRPTLLGAGRPAGEREAGEDYLGRRRRLSASETSALLGLKREQGLSLDTFVKGALALAMGHHFDRNDVVFGATSSGRPAALSGVESMIGLFINTLPVRIQMTAETPLIAWLRRIQIEHAEVRDYEYAPLLKVQQWSELPSGVPLFDTHQIFENYPVDESLEGLPVIPLAARDFRSFTRANFPVSLVSSVLDDELSLKILYDSASVEARFVDRLLDQIHALIARFVSHPHSTVGEMRGALADMDRRAREEDARELETASRRILARTTRRPRRLPEDGP
jgi:hypothetical protein